MTVRCSLGHENPDGSLFCDECGEPLASGAPVAAPAAAQDAGSQVCASWRRHQPGRRIVLLQLRQPSRSAAPAPVATAPAPDFTPAPAAAPVATAAPALTARLIVEADNQEFDLSGKDTIVIGREDAVSNIFPDVDLTPHGGEIRWCFPPARAHLCGERPVHARRREQHQLHLSQSPEARGQIPRRPARRRRNQAGSRPLTLQRSLKGYNLLRD